MDRRSFLAVTLALAGAGRVAASAPRLQAKTRLILLGTAGGPRPRKSRAASAQVIIANGAAYVVDCGDGVARQLVRAGVPLAIVRHVFLTHHHSDHNADYGNLLLLAWTAGLRTRVDAWGPPPLERMTQLFFEMDAADLDARMADERRVPLASLVHAHEIKDAGVVLQDANVTVTATLVHHPPMVSSFAYRFDAADRSIVISGDTTRSDDLAKLAHGADILVHEALYPAGIDRLVAGVGNAADLKRSILSHHTTAEDAGRVAQEAGVKTLVLSHLVPAEDPSITEPMWIAAASKWFRGRVIVGRDLLEL
jgi:ribonuclease BN (tRNA processing enzyme)